MEMMPTSYCALTRFPCPTAELSLPSWNSRLSVNVTRSLPVVTATAREPGDLVSVAGAEARIGSLNSPRNLLPRTRLLLEHVSFQAV